MSETPNTEDRCRKLAVVHLGTDEAKLVRDARLEEDLGADSLDLLELVMAAEEEFGIDDIDDVTFKDGKVSTFGEFVDLVQKHLGD